MAKAKISQLDPKGADLSSTDLFEVSVQTGSGYETYSITGQEIIDGVTQGLSGFVPYTGATQDVDLDANKLSAESVYIEGTNGNGHLHLKHQNSDATATGQSTALWANNDGDLKWKNDNDYKTTLKTSLNTADRVYTFPDANCNLQQELVSGTNIKTINSTSLLGSGNVAVQATLVSGTNIKTINSNSLLGSGDITTPVGIHAPRIPASGGYINPLMVTYQATAATTYAVNALRCFIFMPMKTFTIVSYSINVTTAVAASNMRVLFYDDLNGTPNAKLHESANVDTSTTGVKTVTQAYTFNAGTTYWLCVQTSAAVSMTSHSFNGGFSWQQTAAPNNMVNNVQYTYALGSAPATLTTTGASYATNNLPHLIFNL
jgi:hypothetical protein